MKQIKRLKRLNLLEKLGFFVKEKPKRAIGIGITSVLILFLIAFSPSLIALAKQNIASSYISQSEAQLLEIKSAIADEEAALDSNKSLYKDYDKYKKDISIFKSSYDDLNRELQKYKSFYKNKNINAILSDFTKKKNSSKETFPEIIKKLSVDIAVSSGDVQEVMSIDNGLKDSLTTFSAYVSEIESLVADKYAKLQIVNQKGKNQRVKEKASLLFNTINLNKGTYLSSFEQLPKYSKDAEGKYDLYGLKGLKQRYDATQSNIAQAQESVKKFDSYYSELNVQYYTVVTRHFIRTNIDYVMENNPEYREWQEQENYTEKETRYKDEQYTVTERQYKGSRIVNGTKEDIYENVTLTKTRKVPYTVDVQKTRTVTKNNGKPRTIQVPYQVYEYYYVVDRHDNNGVSKNENYAGKKHTKYDMFSTRWSYNSDQEVGYTVWKQLWNDDEGIVRGLNLNARLE